MISIIAAIGKNNELGKGNALLFSMPADMKYFRETTSGKTIIMGQKTFESIGRPLPKRLNIVVTRDKNFTHDGVEISHSLEDTLKKYKNSPEEVFIIGGGQIYAQSMEYADKLYITHIDATDKDADTFFPEIIPIVWNEISHIEHKEDTENPHDYTFSVYQKFI